MPRQRWADISQRITDRAIRDSQIRDATVVHCYWPLLDKRELDTRPLIRALLDANKRVALPVVTNFESVASDTPAPEPRMHQIELEPTTVLLPNQWNVWEPAGGQQVPFDAIDLVIVPGLCADAQGYRVGYGKGYYDELLKLTDATSLCLLPTYALTESIPHEAHDAPLDIILTESRRLTPHR